MAFVFYIPWICYIYFLKYMELPVIQDKTFKNIDYSVKELTKAEYDNCTFIDCVFADSYISNISFLECEFIDCNLSMAKSKLTTLKDVSFNNCKLVGFPFNTCNDFLMSLNFNGCNLNLSSFSNLNLKSTQFKNCNLQEADFTETDLTNSVFSDCDLNRAIFDNTNLEKVDFRTAHNFLINPEINRLKHAKFTKNNIIGLLKKYNIKIE